MLKYTYANQRGATLFCVQIKTFRVLTEKDVCTCSHLKGNTAHCYSIKRQVYIWLGLSSIQNLFIIRTHDKILNTDYLPC